MARDEAISESLSPSPSEKISCARNPWYLLATVNGEPESEDDPRHKANRILWNRFFARFLDADEKDKLIAAKLYSEAELTPFSDAELQTLRDRYDARQGAGPRVTFPGTPENTSRRDCLIDFSNTAFADQAIFSGYIFNRANFDGAAFESNASFRNCVFLHYAEFLFCKFAETSFFDGALFDGRADANFSGANFSKLADFSECVFSMDYALFTRAHFMGEVRFIGAQLGRYASFRGAIFNGWTEFAGATFSATTFENATINTTAIFTNSEMKAQLSFSGANFTIAPPIFFNAQLHEGTDWGARSWPIPKHADVAKQFVDAYACLKREMDRLKKHGDELDFFALELQSRRIQLGFWRGIPFGVYDALSDFGRSYWRPLGWLIGVAVVAAPAFADANALTIGEALGFSLANMLNVFGFRKDFFEPALLSCLSPSLKILAASQTVIGGALLFLAGLGLRNSFRMK